MKTHPYRLVAVALAVAVLGAAPAKAPKGPKKVITIQGEILDLGCYLSRGLQGELHRECATKCLMSGVPMGLLGPDSTVYILTQNHDRAMEPRSFDGPDPYALCKQSAAKQVAVTALMWERKGYKELEVKLAKVIPPASATP